MANNQQKNLVEYLQKIVQASTKVIRDIGHYEDCFWLEKALGHSNCVLKNWSDPEPKEELLKIKKTSEPLYPTVPKECESWIEDGYKENKESLPRLKDRTKITNKKSGVERLETLTNYPEVQESWRAYIDEKWKPWKIKYNEWKEEQKLYDALYSIYQNYKKNEEKYELVLGLGVLHYKNANGNLIKRQLLVADVEFELIPEKAELIVKILPNGAYLRTELDVLEEKVSKELEDDLRKRIENDSSLTADNIGEILKFILNSIFSDVEYPEGLSSSNIGLKPICTFSPVVILRNRSITGILEALRCIDEQLDKKIETSSIFRQLTEKQHTDDIKGTFSQTFDGEIFFPKPFNDEQLSIVSKINHSNGVVVQGPPGTGKSHTIANLICHLLATGNKVLITAKTTTALSVLRGLLPEQMRSLAVCMLGYGDREKNLLEESVHEILNKGDSFDEEKSKKRIEKLYEKLDSLRRNQAEKERQLVDITRSESHSQTIADGQYSGTATEIAKEINREEEQYEWFKDSISPGERFSLSEEELYLILHGIRKFSKLKNELSQHVEEIMSSEAFSNFVSDLNKVSVLNSEDLQHSKLYCELSAFSEKELEFSLERIRFLQIFKESILPDIESLDENTIRLAQKTFTTQSLRRLLLTHQDALSALEDKLTTFGSQRLSIIEQEQTIRLAKEQILLLSESWIKTILDEAINLVESDEIISRIDDILMKIEKFADIADSYKINIPDGLSLKQMTTAVERLLEYVTKGKSLNKFNILMPPKVRNSLCIVNKVCDTDLSLVELENIKNALFFDTEIYKAIQLLTPYFQVNTSSSRFGQLEQIKRGNSILKRIFEIKKQYLSLQALKVSFADGLKKFVNSYRLLICGALSIDLVEAEKICSFLLLEKCKNNAFHALSSLREQLIKITTNKNAHVVMHNLLKAVEKNDVCMYESERAKLDNLLEKRIEFISINKAIDKVRKIIPLTMKAMEESYEDSNWDSRISKIKQAWYHSQATNWILDYIGVDKSSKIKTELNNISKEIRATIEKITLEKSWSFCITNLTSEQRKHIALWQQAIRKLGKGTGKYANRHIKSAQSHFDQCRDAVPAWIMPLHNVWNNVTIFPGAFDVVIIDEASQCGIEAIPLFYIAKKIIIVGDSKQISPENVGLDRSIAHKWADEYLQNIDKDLFDIDNSIFDIGEAVFNQSKVVLREHFRCMPEIINFSNRLCYQHTPLIPLKQYGKDRLPPLESIFLPDGYREGEGASIL